MDRPGRNQQQHGRRQDTAGATKGEKQQSLAERGVSAPRPDSASSRKSDNDKKA
jgi:hypothetical protein